MSSALSFLFNATASTQIYTLSLHDALPIYGRPAFVDEAVRRRDEREGRGDDLIAGLDPGQPRAEVETADEVITRSEEHTSELQSRQYLVCRLLLEKKKNNTKPNK